MRESGIEIGTSFTETRGVAGTTGYYGAIRVRDGEPRTMKRVADWLNEQPWCAHVFTPSAGDGLNGIVAGTLARSLLMRSSTSGGSSAADDCGAHSRSIGKPRFTTPYAV